MRRYIPKNEKEKHFLEVWREYKKQTRERKGGEAIPVVDDPRTISGYFRENLFDNSVLFPSIFGGIQ